MIMRHVERARSQPDHIRKQLAIGASFVLTAFVALAWLGGSLATGSFAVKGSSFADLAKAAVPENQAPQGSGFAGAAAAVFGAPAAPAHIEIVDTNVHSTIEEKDPTIIPF